MSTTSPSIRRVAYTTKADAVYAELRRSILGAAIAPGSPLNQEQLAATLGVSTTPLREALRRLEAEGLVEVTAHRQLVVTTAEIADLPNLFLVKEELDCLAARLAARRATEDDRRLLQDALSPEPPDGDVRWAGWAANKELHLAIVRATHNPVLIEELERLLDRYDRYLPFFDKVVFFDPVARSEHAEIVAAILDGRGDDAAALMRAHYRRGWDAMAAEGLDVTG